MVAESTSFFRKILDKWIEDDGITNSAALSFHAIIGLPALLLFALFIGSIFLKQQIIEAAIITDVSLFADDFVIKALNSLFTQLSVNTSFNLSIIISFFIYIWSAGNIFHQLQKMINKMWGTKPSSRSWLHQLVLNRFSAFVAAFVFGLLVPISTLFEVVFFVISDNLQVVFSIPTVLVELTSFGINFLTLIALFMYIFRVLPEATPDLKHAFIGALLTVILLTMGKYIIGVYLFYSNITTVYGTIGSILVVFMWIYMSSIIVTFMAEFMGVYSESV
ncbi:YihY/virulence factor BrkB family protein [Methanolobus sp.]|jgi:membrane protein|uniref:YihY/virulence factor BrkB family protein n=1 Tax=Methanolobus sp. TaxID=1874737 RepID=UPI0025E91A7D|nr:YihY/virulence factor BrkB family protein [Methanolobus sp.]